LKYLQKDQLQAQEHASEHNYQETNEQDTKDDKAKSITEALKVKDDVTLMIFVNHICKS
jgi:ATP-dependent Clp protease adapter protein ClpS